MKTPNISIIIPVYNVEKYLPECLNSISVQTFTDWECLLIDDGSPDNSGAICDEYATKDNRFKVFHKPNGGVSSARNFGLGKAHGEWVTFIDSDDFISQTYIEGLYSPIAAGEHLDFIHGGCSNWCDGKVTGINQSYEYYRGDNPALVFNNMRGLIVSKLFKLEHIRNWQNGKSLKFDENMKIAEDMAFTIDYLLKVREYAFVSETGYFYRADNLTSATKRKVKKSYTKELTGWKHIFDSSIWYVRCNKIEYTNMPQRAQVMSDILFDVLVVLAETSELSAKEKSTHLQNDFSFAEFQLLDYISKSFVKNRVLKSIEYNHFALGIFWLRMVKYEIYLKAALRRITRK